jgi:hypothetical protein
VVLWKGECAVSESHERSMFRAWVLDTRTRKTLYWIRVRRRSVRGELILAC